MFHKISWAKIAQKKTILWVALQRMLKKNETKRKRKTTYKD